MEYSIAIRSKYRQNKGKLVYFSDMNGWKTDGALANKFDTREDANNYAKRKFVRYKEWFIVENNSGGANIKSFITSNGSLETEISI